jgi:hypothetical protein
MSLDALFTGKFPKGEDSRLEDLFTPYDIRNVLPTAMAARAELGDGVYGGVDRRLPYTLQLNPRTGLKKNAPHVIAHEYEHMLQNNVDARYKENNSNWDQEFIKQSKIPTKDLVDFLKKSAVNKTIPFYMEKTYGFPIKYFGDMQEGDYSLREQFAEISAAEQFLKKDLTEDKFIRKNVFFDNPNLIKAYKATTGLRTNRLDAKDLPPMQVK